MVTLGTEPLWTDKVSAYASIATVLLLLLAGGIAYWQAREARSLRRAQSRPFVVIDFDAQAIHPFTYLRIVNVGTTMARNVRFMFKPPIASTFDSQSGVPPTADLTILKDGIRTLPPDKEIRFLFDTNVDRYKSQLPDKYNVTVDYDGEIFRNFVKKDGREHFTDEMAHDLSVYHNLTHITRRGQHDIHERVEEIRDILKRWSASGTGLLVLNPEDVQKRDDAWLEHRRELEEARQRAAQEEGDA